MSAISIDLAELKSKAAFQSDDECVIAEQVVATCDMVSHLYGGYRPVLSDACFRHQACSICVSSLHNTLFLELLFFG